MQKENSFFQKMQKEPTAKADSFVLAPAARICSVFQGFRHGSDGAMFRTLSATISQKMSSFCYRIQKGSSTQSGEPFLAPAARIELTTNP